MTEQAERQPAFQWAGKPVYRCAHYPACQYERVENLPAVLAHEQAVHGPVVRDALIVGPEGERLQVAEHTPPPAAQGTPAPATAARRTRRAR